MLRLGDRIRPDTECFSDGQRERQRREAALADGSRIGVHRGLKALAEK